MIEAGVVYLLLSLCDPAGACTLQLERLPPNATVATCRSSEPAVRAWAARRERTVGTYRCVQAPR